jgi:phenylalanyl-tRNA synthetase alpha subunit
MATDNEKRQQLPFPLGVDFLSFSIPFVSLRSMIKQFNSRLFGENQYRWQRKFSPCTSGTIRSSCESTSSRLDHA